LESRIEHKPSERFFDLRAVFPHMRDAGRAIINFAAVPDFLRPTMVAYNCAKAGIEVSRARWRWKEEISASASMQWRPACRYSIETCRDETQGLKRWTKRADIARLSFSSPLKPPQEIRAGNCKRVGDCSR